MARGNAFNKTVEKSRKYPFSEVHLANGKRLDSYDDIEKLIVSRKATDLENIELSTFESYLKEMKIKYKPGELINSPKYGDLLKGKELTGKQILEIPESNKLFVDIGKYQDLAKKYDIEIRFAAE